MDPIGGIVSGLDTASLIDSIISEKSKAKNRLVDEKEYLEYKRQANLDVNKSLNSFENVALSLRLEQTFLSKILSYSNSDYVSVTANPGAAEGSYNYEVSQLAVEARTSSFYSNIKILSQFDNTTGITGISGYPKDTLEGTRKIEVFDSKSYMVYGSVVESSIISGTIAGDIGVGSNSLDLTINGTNISIVLDDASADVSTLSDVADDLSAKINEAMNIVVGTTDKTYVSVDLINDDGTGNGYFKITDKIAGYANTIAVTGGNAQSVLGLDTTWSEESSDAYAKVTFTPHNNSIFKAIVGNANLESTTIIGTVASTVSNGTFGFDYGDTSVEVTLDDFAAGSTELQNIAYDLQGKINEELNSINDTSDKSYVMVSVMEDADTGNDTLVLYNAIPGDPNTFSNFTGTAVAALGFDSGTSSINTTTIEKTITDITMIGEDSLLSNLAVLINDDETGLIEGVQFSGNALEEGEMTVVTDSSLNLQARIKEKITGSEASSGSGLNINAIGLSNANFSKTVNENVNGYFTINDKKIFISDYTAVSVNDVLSMINSSGAGVTASYDEENDKIILESNNFDNDIVLGNSADTSNFLTIAKLNSSDGAIRTDGTTLGSIDPNTKLIESNLFISPVSGTFSINGVSIYVDAYRDTLSDVLDKINNSSANVYAYYSQGDDKVFLQSKSDEVESNTNKITLGGKNDTSNLLMSLNLVNTVYTGIEGSAENGNKLSDTIEIMKGNSVTQVNIPTTTGSGAYMVDSVSLNLGAGLEVGATFDILAGTDGNTLYHWQNNSGHTITDIDDFIEQWNYGVSGSNGNWIYQGGYSAPAVYAVKEGYNNVRFFSASSGTAASFTITEKTVGDADKIGVTSGATISNGASSVADAEYNALNFSFAVNQSDADVWVQTDGFGNVKVNNGNGVNSALITLKDISGNRGTISDYFGSTSVTSTQSAQEVGIRGQDLKIKLNGQEYTRTSNRVDDLINEVVINFNSLTEKVENFTIQNDTDTTLKEISKFIAAYNKVAYLLNPERLTEDEKKYLEKLSDEDKADMTYSAIEEYEANYNMYTKIDIISKDPTMKSLYAKFKEVTLATINGTDGGYDSLASINIQSRNYTTGLDDYKKGLLFMDSVDEDEIFEALQDNYILKNALESDPEAVYKIFAQQGYEGSGSGTYGATSIDPTNGITIPRGGGDVRFYVSDGIKKSGQIVLQEGVTYSQSEIAEIFDRAGFQLEGTDRVGDTVNVKMGFFNNRLGMEISKLSSKDTNSYELYIKDLSTGSNNLYNTLGVEASGNITKGLARQWEDLIDSYIGIDGIIKRRTQTSGLFDQQDADLDEKIDNWDYRLDSLKTRLWNEFNRMESAMSDMQSQADYFQQQLSAMTGSSSSSSE